MATLLEFCLDRAARLNYLLPEAWSEAKFFLRAMDRGYQLRFTRSALVFDFTKLGGEQSLEDDEIEFHRIGIDRIRSLLEALPSKCDDDTKPSLEPKEPDSSSSVRLDAVGRLKTAVAEPDSAVFLPASRTRSTSWHLLKSSTDDLDDLPPAKSDPDIPPAGPAPLDATVRPESSSASRSDQPQVVKGDEMSSQPLLVREAASPLEIPAASSLPAAQSYDAIVGVAGESPQFGILGRFHGRTIALDLNQTHTISLFGVQGGGKSYTLGSIIEMACLPLPGINHLPRPTLQQIGRFRRSAQVYRKPGPRGGSGIVREMRHKGTSVLVASQDPPSVPVALIELSTQIVLHRFNSPAWLKHIPKANAALASLSAEQSTRLRPLRSHRPQHLSDIALGDKHLHRQHLLHFVVFLNQRIEFVQGAGVIVPLAALLADFGFDVFDEIQLAAMPMVFADHSHRRFAVTEFAFHRTTPSHKR